MYLLKVTPLDSRVSAYLTEDAGWSFARKNARRFKAEELIPTYQRYSAHFRTSSYSIDIERVED